MRTLTARAATTVDLADGRAKMRRKPGCKHGPMLQRRSTLQIPRTSSAAMHSASGPKPMISFDSGGR